MGQAETAAGFDRLPWLDDEPAPRARRGNRELAAWVAVAVALVAGTSYWLGLSGSRDEEPASIAPPAPRTSTTAQLPEARPAKPTVAIEPAPEVEPVAEPAVRPVAEPPVRVRREAPRPTARTAPIAAPPPAIARPLAPLPLWPSRQAAGAAGRLVQIGAFGTRLRAKRGWAYLARAYPGLKRLPAVVVPARNSKGRVFYRFQIGTTSQAHSEVLCQRMEKIRFSCAVVGLPWKPKGVER